MLDDARLVQALQELGRTLADRELTFHVAIVGGAALLLRGLRDRPTQDVDVAAVAEGSETLRGHHVLPPALQDAAADVALVLRLGNPDWMNAGCVAILGDQFPSDFAAGADVRVFDGLIVSVLGRRDLVRLKLYAASDEGPGSWHLDDLRVMRVTEDELQDAREWVLSATNQHPDLIADAIAALRGR